MSSLADTTTKRDDTADAIPSVARQHEPAPSEIPRRPPAELAELRCRGRRADSSVRYRDPEADSPDFTGRAFACTSVPDFGTGSASGIVQRGCESDAACALREWDPTANPPAWWPCPL